MGELLALGSAFFFAISAILIRRGSELLDAKAGHLLSLLVNAFINTIALTLRIQFGSPFQPTWVGVAYFVSGGLMTMFLGRIYWIGSIQNVGPARAGSFKMAQLVFVLLVAVTVMGESASWLGLAGAVLILVGLAGLTMEGRSEQVANPNSDRRRGVLYGWASAGAFGVGNLLRKQGMTVWPDAVAGAATGALIAATTAVVRPQAFTRLRAAFAVPSERVGVRWYMGAGAFSSASQFCLYGALGLEPIWKVNLLAGTEPLVVTLLGLLLLRGRESRGIRLWLGVGLVTAGVALIAVG